MYVYPFTSDLPVTYPVPRLQDQNCVFGALEGGLSPPPPPPPCQTGKTRVEPGL